MSRNGENFEHVKSVLDLHSKGLSQRAIAQAVGIPRTSVQRIIDSRTVVDDAAEAVKVQAVSELLGELARGILADIASYESRVAKDGLVLPNGKAHPLLAEIRHAKSSLRALYRDPRYPQ
jgi:hypothetical protein